MSTIMITRKAVLRVIAPAAPSRRRLIIRASETSASEPSTSSNVASEAPITNISVTIPQAVPVPAATTPSVSFTDAMAFSNPVGPETINGRLAMLGVLAAVGAEFATGKSFFTQFQEGIPVVLAIWALVAVASLVPIMKGADPTEAFGPLTRKAEVTNGRAAMLGLGALVLIELIKGSALF